MGSLFSFKFSSSSCHKRRNNKKNILLLILWGGFLYFHQNFLHLQVEKKYSFASSLRGGSLFSSSSSCQKKRIKNILLHFFKGWVLYFHLNFLLLPVTKEEIIKKNILLLLLWGGVFIFNLYFLILFPVKKKKRKIFFFYCYEGVSLFSSKFSSSSFPKRRKN